MALAASAIGSRCLPPHSAIAAITGSSVQPNFVRRYSVLGGTTGYSFRETSAHSSSSFSSFDRMRSLIGGQARRSSEKRRLSLRINAQTRRAFHLPPITRVVKATGQGLEKFIRLDTNKNIRSCK